MPIKRIGKTLPGNHSDVFGEDVANSPEFNNLCIYTLPRQLLDLIVQQQPGLLSADQLQKELLFAEDPMTAVYVRGVARPVMQLRKFSAAIDEALCIEMFGGNSTKAVMKAIHNNSRKIDQIGKAYCGWLVQQMDYQLEIKALREALQADQCDSPSNPPESNCSCSSKVEEIRAEICKKWRLSSLFTTEIPAPSLPHFSALNRYSDDPPEGSVVPSIPDTFPIPGTGFVVDQLNNSRKTPDAGHLSSWQDLTSNRKGNTRPFESLARQYQLQHYWRVLKTRYPKETRRKRKDFSCIFAEYFDVSQDTILRDFKKLNCKSDLLRQPIEIRF